MAQAPKRPFFNAGVLPQPKLEYVAWLDVMGVRAIMSRSLPTSASFVFKLHTAVLHAPHQPLRLYPVMDGVTSAVRHAVELRGQQVLHIPPDRRGARRAALATAAGTHPTTVQPETLGVLLKHLVVTEEPPPAAA